MCSNDFWNAYVSIYFYLITVSCWPEKVTEIVSVVFDVLKKLKKVYPYSFLKSLNRELSSL